MSADGDFIRSVDWTRYWVNRKLKELNRKDSTHLNDLVQVLNDARDYIELSRCQSDCDIWGDELPPEEQEEADRLFKLIYTDMDRWSEKAKKKSKKH